MVALRFCLLLSLSAMVLSVEASEMPKHVQSDIGLAKAVLESEHTAIPIWPEHPQIGTVLRSQKPIDSMEELKSVLAAVPKGCFKGSQFGETSQFEGWFAASLDALPGRSLWIQGVLVQKGSSELYLFSNW